MLLLSMFSCKKDETISQSVAEKIFFIEKDALVHSLTPDKGIASHPQILAMAWTDEGTPFVTRAYFNFDLSGLPEGAVVREARLSLYHHVSHNNHGHSQLGGSNAAILKQISEPWEETTLSWNNQPATADANSISLKESDFEMQDYEIDVTPLLKQPASCFGFMLKLENETYYRSLTFGASDALDANVHPELVITYSTNQ